MRADGAEFNNAMKACCFVTVNRNSIMAGEAMRTISLLTQQTNEQNAHLFKLMNSLQVSLKLFPYFRFHSATARSTNYVWLAM